MSPDTVHIIPSQELTGELVVMNVKTTLSDNTKDNGIGKTRTQTVAGSQFEFTPDIRQPPWHLRASTHSLSDNTEDHDHWHGQNINRCQVTHPLCFSQSWIILASFCSLPSTTWKYCEQGENRRAWTWIYPGIYYGCIFLSRYYPFINVTTFVANALSPICLKMKEIDVFCKEILWAL